MTKKTISLDSLIHLRKARALILLTEAKRTDGFTLSDQAREHFKTHLGFNRKDVDDAINDLCAAGFCTANPTDSGISVDLITLTDEPEKEEK